MRKLINLIINENIKVFLKISTIIMLVVTILLAVGYNGMYFFVSVNDRNNSYSYDDTDFQSIIDTEKKDKIEGWEARVEAYEFLIKNNVQNHSDWRAAAAFEAFNLKSAATEQQDETEKAKLQKSFDTMLTQINNDDWKAYLKNQLDELKDNKDYPSAEKETQLWALQYRLDNDIRPDWNTDDWKTTLFSQVENCKRAYAEEMEKPYGERDQKQLAMYNDAALIGLHRLDNNIEYALVPDNLINVLSDNDPFSFWSTFRNSILLISVISVLIIIVAGSSIATEFSNGTVKFLLINPVKRWKIFVAKYISTLTIAFLMLFIYYIFNALLGALFFGFNNLSAPYLMLIDGDIVQISGFLFVAWKYLLGSVNLIAMATFAFAISSLVRNSALSIGLGVFLMLSGNTAVLFLKELLGVDWARYIIFANTDLNMILTKSTPFLGHSVSFALATLAVYMVVFLLTAWDGFVRRDVR